MTVRFADAEPNPLADMVGRLIEANLEHDPRRRGMLRPVVVELSAADAGIGATVRVSRGGVSISNTSEDGIQPHLRVVADAYDLVQLAAAPVRFGLPDVLDEHGRAVLRRIARGHVRVSGMLRHPVRLTRFNRLLSAGRDT